MSMPRIRLPVIPEPKEGTRAIFAKKGESPGPWIQGEGDTDLICGGCEYVLAHGIEQGQIQGIVLLCPSCGAYNNT
jgi:hypothetical protein